MHFHLKCLNNVGSWTKYGYRLNCHMVVSQGTYTRLLSNSAHLSTGYMFLEKTNRVTFMGMSLNGLDDYYPTIVP